MILFLKISILQRNFCTGLPLVDVLMSSKSAIYIYIYLDTLINYQAIKYFRLFHPKVEYIFYSGIELLKQFHFNLIKIKNIDYIRKNIITELNYNDYSITFIQFQIINKKIAD